MRTGIDGAEWPLVGRDEELALLRAWRDDVPPRGALITGPPGVGKSRLARVTAEHAVAEGWATVSLQGSTGFRAVPLGPLRTVLRVPGLPSLADLLVSVEQALEARRSSRGLVVVANDCQFLDPATVGLLHQMAAVGSIVLVATARTNTMPSDLHTLAREERATRLELQDLSERESRELLEVALGAPVQDSSAGRLWTITGGNPLYLREVVLTSLESGALAETSGEWRWRGKWAHGDRVQEIVSERVGRLSVDATHAVEIVALAGPLPVSLVTSLASARALEELEESALVVLAWEGDELDVDIAHPLHGEVLRDRMPTLRRRAIWRNLVEVLNAAGPVSNANQVRRACWSQAAGLDVDPVTLLRGVDASLFSVGNDITRRLGEIFPDLDDGHDVGDGPRFREDHDLAVRYAETAYAATRAVREGIALVEALGWTNDIRRADQVLTELSRVDLDPDDRARVILARAWIRFWNLNDVDGAVSLLRGVVDDDSPLCSATMRASAYQQLAGIALNTANPTAALDYAQASADCEGVALSSCLAAPAAAASLLYLGRCDAALTLVEDSLPVLSREGHTLSVAMLLFAKAAALGRAGRLREASELAEWLRNLSVTNDHLDATAAYGVLLGDIYLAQGRPSSAGRVFQDAAGLLAEHDVLGYRPWALYGLARAKAMIGETASARAALEEARGIEMIGRHYDVACFLAEFEIHERTGETGAALASLREGVAWARDAAMTVNEAQLWATSLRVEPGVECSQRLAELATLTDSTFVRVLAEYAEALLRDDADALARCADEFAAMTAYWLASESLTAAARSYARHRNAGASKSAFATAARWAAHCEGATSSLSGGSVTAAPLTAREREVADLAARGRSSQEIADELFVSRRTVESHLHHAFLKLNVSNRVALAAALSVLPPQ